MKVFWVLPVVLVTTVGGVFYWYRSTAEWRQAAGKLSTQMEIARRHGIPLQASDLIESPAIPDEDNGATAILIATDAAKRIEDPGTDWRSLAVLMFQNPLPLKAIRQQLAPYEKLFPLARNAAKYSACDFHRNYDFGPRLDVADVGDDRLLVRLLCFSAELAACRNDVPGCISDLRAARRLTYLIGTDHAAISIIGSTSAESLVLRYASVCLNKFEHNAEGLEAIRAFAREDAPLPDLRAALRGEAYFGVNWVRNYEDPVVDRNGDVIVPKGAPDLSGLQLSGMPRTLKQQAYLTHLLEVWNGVFEILDKGGTGREISAFMGKAINDANYSNDPTMVLNRQALYSLEDMANSVDRIKAHRLLTAELAMVLQYRLKNGKMPKTLDQAGVHDIDPFNGEPMKMVSSDKELRIYSVGEDMTDNNGMTGFEMGIMKGIVPSGDEIVVFPATLVASRRG